MTRCLLCHRITSEPSYCLACKPNGKSRGHDWSRRIVPAVLNRDGHRCVMCGSTGPLDVDHIQPISQGGGDDMPNLRAVCRAFNRGGKPCQNK